MSAKKWAILPSIIPPGHRPEGFEPTNSGLEHRHSTNWAMTPDWVTLWSKYFITLFVTCAKTGWLGRSCLDLYYHRKHVKDTINHQLLKLTLFRLVSYVAVIYFGPQEQREQRRGKCPWGFSCYPAVRTGSSNTRFFFWGGGSLAPDLRSFKTILAGNFPSIRVYSPEFSW